MIRGKVFVAMLLGLLLLGGAFSVAEAAGPPQIQSSKVECIRMGLSPISTDVHVLVRGLPESSTPFLDIRWRGRQLPASCQLERTVGADVEVRFAKLRKWFSFGFGFPSRWHVFLGSRQTKGHGYSSYEGPAVEAGSLGCIERVRARLRYRVLAPGGVVVAQRVRSTPVRYRGCAR